MWDKLFSSVNLLQKGVEASWMRNAVLRNNIANAETPGFKSSEVEFEGVFAQILETAADTRGGFKGKMTRRKHIPIGAAPPLPPLEARVVQVKDTAMLFNENNVDVEAENVKLAQNSIYYNALVEKLNGDLGRLKLAIREGK
ncbi:MAG: flagellar basal body rod protein FlgB [Clostridiales bacterium]|nr:flagellar basal body rod protein FlgB [Clostridiales bacterium]